MRGTRNVKAQADPFAENTRYTPPVNPKDEAAKILRKHGFDAESDHSIVMVYYSVPGTTEQVLAEVKEVLASIPYTGSFGVKFGKGQGFDPSQRERFSHAADDEDDVGEIPEEV